MTSSASELEMLADRMFRYLCLAQSVMHLPLTTKIRADSSQPQRYSRTRRRIANVKTLALLCLCGGIQAVGPPRLRFSAAFASCLVGLQQLRGPATAMPRHVLKCSAPSRSEDSAGFAGGPWRAEEDWAILDETPAFTVGSGANAVTFWSALATASTVLCQRTAPELELRMARLAADRDLSSASFGREPSVLSSWERLPDGRFTGAVDGRTVWLTVELEGRLASDPRPGAGYLISLGGRVYELGESGGRPEEPGTSILLPGGKDERVDRLDLQSMGASATGWLPFLGTAILAGGVGLLIGVSNVVPRDMVPGVAISAVSPKTQPPLAAQKMLPAAPPSARQSTTAPTSPKRESVPILLSEQRARLLIEVDKQKAVIAMQEKKLQADQDPGSIQAKIAAEQARLQSSLERQSKANQEKIGAMEKRLQADVERQKDKLTSQRLKLRQGEELALELQRVEAERGSDAAAVQMSVPRASERFE